MKKFRRRQYVQVLIYLAASDAPIRTANFIQCARRHKFRVNFNEVDEYANTTALMETVASKDFDLVAEFLQEPSLNINYVTPDGSTALSWFVTQ